MAKEHWMLLGGGAGVGAGLMYLLDPQSGNRRRAVARDKAVSAANKSGDTLRKASKDLGNRGKGLYAAVGSRLSSDEASDPKLTARVRSVLGHHVSHPGAVTVYAENGKITLGGPILVSELAGFLAAVEAVKGVQGVLDHLEVHETAENVPEFHHGGVVSEPERSRTLPPAARLLAGAAGSVLALAGLKRRDKVGAALGSVGLGLLATGGIAGRNPVGLLRRRSGKLDDRLANIEPLRDAEKVPAQGTEEGTFQPATL
jgi:hypothetical protein